MVGRQCALFLAALLTVTACGATSPSKSDDGARVKAKASASAAAVAKAQQVKRDAAYSTCAAAVKPLRGALAQVNSRLNVGLNYQDYDNRIGDVRVAYDAAVPRIKAVGGTCLAVAVPLENAMNAYIKVATQWGACLDDYNCDFSKGETNDKAQAGWQRAGRALTNSDRRLAAIRTP
jgi:hypothetical protein